MTGQNCMELNNIKKFKKTKNKLRKGVKDMTREQLVKKATDIAEKHFDEVGLETFRIAIKSEQCFDSDIEDFIESWEEGDGWSASTFLSMACTY